MLIYQQKTNYFKVKNILKKSIYLGVFVVFLISVISCEEDFADILRKTPKSERNEFEGLIAVGLEYGDNDYDGKMDNKRMETEFPKLTETLNE